MSLPVGSKWLIKRAGVPNQVIKVVANSGVAFEATYVGIDNPSKFSGQVRARQTKAINIVQVGYDTGYAAFHSGLRLGTNNNQYVGTWYDVAGNSGYFELTRL